MLGSGKDMNESDPRSDVQYLGSSENKAWKKVRYAFFTVKLQKLVWPFELIRQFKTCIVQFHCFH